MMNFDKDIYYLGVGAQLLNSSDTVNTAKLTITEGDKKEYVVTGSDDNVFVLDRIHNPDKNTIEISIKGLSKGGGFMMGTHLQPPSDQDAASVIVYDCKVKIKQPDNINHLHPDESAKFSIDFANTDVGYSNPTWQVDDKTIANIDAKGELTILKPGKVNVKLILSYNGIEFFDDVAVNIAVPPISFDKDEYLMGIGGHLVNKADSSTQATIDFHGVDFSHYIVESSDESVFTVKKLPDSGQLGSVALTAVGKGKAQLTVKNDKSIKTVPVEILSKHVSILDFFELHVNQLTRMKLDVFTDVGYSNPEWSIIDGDKYASIDNLGLVRPKEQGRFRAQVIVTYSGIKFSAFRDIIIAHEISSVKPIILTDLPETYNYSELTNPGISIRLDPDTFLDGDSSIQWYKIESSGYHRPMSNGNTTLLPVDSHDNSGIYYCVCTNNIGSTTSKQCKVTYYDNSDCNLKAKLLYKIANPEKIKIERMDCNLPIQYFYDDNVVQSVSYEDDGTLILNSTKFNYGIYSDAAVQYQNKEGVFIRGDLKNPQY